MQQYPSVGPAGGKHTNAIKVLPSKTPADQAASLDPLIGKKIWIRRPADNHFYEAVITAKVCLDQNSCQNLWLSFYLSFIR